MARVLLLHWNEAEVLEKAAGLEAVGFEVDACWNVDGGEMKRIREKRPAAIVVDLTRLPSHGRSVGAVLRQTKATRQVPILFVGGEAEKVKRVKEALPDAVYCSWRAIASALKKTLAAGTREFAAFKSNSGGYSGTPLPKKLGVDGDKSVLLIKAPEGFEAKIGVSEGDRHVRRGGRGKADVVILFVGSRAEYQKKLPAAMKAMAEDRGALWVAWPKKASGVKTNIDENFVRDLGLAAGIVDYKVCAIDEMWSGLKFARRKKS